MNVLKIAVLIFTLVCFVLSALMVRNDPENKNPGATIVLCLSMAALCTVF